MLIAHMTVHPQKLLHGRLFFFFFFNLKGYPDQLARTSTNPTGPEVNDHISLQ